MKISQFLHRHDRPAHLHAAIDVGSNSVLLLSAELVPSASTIGKILRPYRECIATTRLGGGLSRHGSIPRQAVSDTCDVIGQMVELCEDDGIPQTQIRMVATEALRIAADGEEVAREIKQKTGITLHVISAQREAALVTRGVQASLNNPVFPMLILDIGGGSTEVTILPDPVQEPLTDSYSLGCLSLTRQFNLHQRISPDLTKKVLQHIGSVMETESIGLTAMPVRQAIGVGGTMSTLAAIDLALPVYDAGRIEGHLVSPDSFMTILRTVTSRSTTERQAITGLSNQRAEIIAAGLLICSGIIQRFNLSSLIVSTWGLRHGLLLENEPEAAAP